ncbi:Subtilisin-like protease SBT1-5 [Nymphaea thermarum]|nr:Subtilisin-like protease SBT1-5 [Nymphaea thermarum]
MGMALSWFLLSALCSVLSAGGRDERTFIVGVQSDLKPSAFASHERWYQSSLRNVKPAEQVAAEDGECTGILHVYDTVFQGFSARMTPEEAEEMGKNPAVLKVIPDGVMRLHTTRSPEFLGLVPRSDRLLGLSRYGSDIVIGVLDSGICPERRSFSDRGLGPVPAKWKGVCEEGKDFPKTSCNRKLVGARMFPAGYQAEKRGKINESEVLSPRDSMGHGTHTASTAAGRRVWRASLLGLAEGVASGMAPRSRIAVYKICWSASSCHRSDILAAFDRAVGDGVDVISISVGGGYALPFDTDPIAIGAFAATAAGVFVAASAGNDGPGSMTVDNVSPWITTVGAGTMDRNFPADVILGDGRVFAGESLYRGPGTAGNQSFPIVIAKNVAAAGKEFTAPLCMDGTLDPAKAAGKIVICDRGGIDRIVKSEVVRKAGGAGAIIGNGNYQGGEEPIPDPYLLPTVSVGSGASLEIQYYAMTKPNGTARLVFRGTHVGAQPAPMVAAFSARGPVAGVPELFKPDLIAPGVSILAAWPDGLGPSGLSSDIRRTEFNIYSGTSMSCPHVSGIAALLKGAHPDWSPAAIRSAMMTTAYSTDRAGSPIADANSRKPATVLDFGSGHVNPERAVDPGLVYDISPEDYVQFLCDSNYTEKEIRVITGKGGACSGKKKGRPADLNYPAIAVQFDQGPKANGSLGAVELVRTVTNVVEGSSRYAVEVVPPKGTSVVVEPTELVFGGRKEKKRYRVRVEARCVNFTDGIYKYEWGSLTWRDGRHTVRSPVLVTWIQKCC